MLILQRRFSDVLLCDEDVAPTLEAGAGGGGNNLPMIMQNVTGTLNHGAHPGSYNGQDAYNDMLVTDGICISGNRDLQGINDSVCAEGARSQGCNGFNSNRGG